MAGLAHNLRRAGKAHYEAICHQKIQREVHDFALTGGGKADKVAFSKHPT